MPRILALDAAAGGVSIALAEGARIVAYVEWREDRMAGERLLFWVRQIVGGASAPGGVAVGLGPGSFTGTRVAVTAAKALAWAWGVPLLAASSLQALAAAVPMGPSAVLSSTERRGEEVYIGRYFRGQSGAEALAEDSRWQLPNLPDMARRPGDALVVVGALAADAEFIARMGARTLEEEVGAARGLVALATAGQLREVDRFTLEPTYLRGPLILPRSAMSAAHPPGRELSNGGV